ncbi:nucleoside-triphosphatase [Natronolimnohabitans innermongolicus]|uniref:Nucleoside-triphosphatase C493_16389 n=1 Tax=Natronolimnohabitans innermongolicus JCM 12255 TaxID=1227499 RepID=L9WRX6_9EURY|nr:nucleoside-triphosphatase [Natronolimnohabitans innermongolicus]ELY52244.1 nucleotide kinase related protein [Natronolimnohabitans innermongolicus JCM 12255]
MPTNALVTGPPRSGKTTALERAVSRLREDDVSVGGLSSPEIREDGERVGFEIVDLASGERELMAHVTFDGDDNPTVGAYGVDVDAVDRLATTALPTAIETADCVVIDEIAPMQLSSEDFVRETRRALESPTPVLAAIKADATAGVLGAIKMRTDTERFVVEPETRERIPTALVRWVQSSLRPR